MQPDVPSYSFLCRCVVVLLNPKKNRQNHIITSRWAENITRADADQISNPCTAFEEIIYIL